MFTAKKKPDFEAYSAVDSRRWSAQTPPSKKHAHTSLCCCVNNKTTNKGGIVKGGKTTRHPNPTDDTLNHLRAKLKTVGMSEEMSVKLLKTYPSERVARQLDILPYRRANKPAALLVKAIREDWDAPQSYLEAKRNLQLMNQNATEIQEKLARIKADEVSEKQWQQKMVHLAKTLSPLQRNALLKEAERNIRKRIKHSWPPSKPIPPSFLRAEYYRLIEARVVRGNPTTKK